MYNALSIVFCSLISLYNSSWYDELRLQIKILIVYTVHVRNTVCDKEYEVRDNFAILHECLSTFSVLAWLFLKVQSGK